MALETGTYINSLNASNPVSTDPISAADDHIRLTKSTIKATFPSITGAVDATLKSTQWPMATPQPPPRPSQAQTQSSSMMRGR